MVSTLSNKSFLPSATQMARKPLQWEDPETGYPLLTEESSKHYQKCSIFRNHGSLNHDKVSDKKANSNGDTKPRKRHAILWYVGFLACITIITPTQGARIITCIKCGEKNHAFDKKVWEMLTSTELLLGAGIISMLAMCARGVGESVLQC